MDNDHQRPRYFLPMEHRARICGEPRFDLAARQLVPQHDRAALIEADDVKRILATIDPWWQWPRLIDLFVPSSTGSSAS
jgi:hypothetical protein